MSNRASIFWKYENIVHVQCTCFFDDVIRTQIFNCDCSCPTMNPSGRLACLMTYLAIISLSNTGMYAVYDTGNSSHTSRVAYFVR